MKRSLEQNEALHSMFREILQHIRARGVKLPDGKKGEDLIKEMCKTAFGPKMRIGKVQINKPTSMYSTQEMSDFITEVMAYAAMDLGLEIHIS